MLSVYLQIYSFFFDFTVKFQSKRGSFPVFVRIQFNHAHPRAYSVCLCHPIFDRTSTCICVFLVRSGFCKFPESVIFAAKMTCWQGC